MHVLLCADIGKRLNERLNVDWLDEMMMEPSLVRQLPVRGLSVTGKCDESVIAQLRKPA